MGHTIPPKRNIIYRKLEDLMRFADITRQPYRERFKNLIESVYQDISSIIYTNSLDDDEMIIYAMLFERSKSITLEDKEKILRCLAILLT